MPKIRTITDCQTITIDGKEFNSDENSSAIEKLHDHLLSEEVKPEHILPELKKEVPAEPVTKEDKLPPEGPPKPPETLSTPEHKGPVTSIQNAVVNAERLAKNLSPVVKEARKKFGTTWDEAMNNVRVGMVDPRTYVSAMQKAPDKFPITDLTSAYILMDRVDLTNQKIEALDRYDKAVKTGNDNVEAAAWRDLQDVEGKLQQNDEVADKVGTITGRALSARRMLASLDYSLVSMKHDIAKYYPDNQVPPHVEERLKEIEKEHAEAMKKLSDYEEKWKKFQAGNRFKDEVKKTSSKKAETEKSIKQKGKEVADRIRKLKRPSDTLGIDFTLGSWDIAVEGVAKLVEAGAKIADAIDQLLNKEFGFKSEDDEKKFREYLLSADQKTVKEIQLGKINELAKSKGAETITKNMITPLRRLINDYAKNGYDDLEKVLDDVHDNLKDSFTDLTKDDLRNAYSGYGDVKLDTKEGLQQKIRNWKQEAKLVGQISDVLAGEKPKIGFRVKARSSEKIEALRKELQSRMKEQGISWDRPPKTVEEKRERALESLKTRLKKEIDNITNAIVNKTDLPERQRTEYDDETKSLIKQRNELRDVLNKVLGKEDKKTLTYAQRVDHAEKILEKQTKDLSDDIAKIRAGEYKPSSKQKPVESITLRLMRGRRDALKELKRKLLVDTSPDSSEPAIALEKYKDSIRDRLLEYQRKIEDKDFDDDPKEKSFLNDAEAVKLEVELKRAQTAYKQEKINAQKTNRSRLQKIFDRINEWKRFSVLTGIPTIGKLGGAALWRNVVTPIEELTGSVLRYTLPGAYTLSKLAPREGGGINYAAEGSAIMQWAKATTYKDALDVLKKGQGELDYRFGKYVSMPPEALGVMGRLHGAMKNTIKRQEFARSYEKRMQHAIDNGANPADELTQLTAMSQAYIDANRSIFMQDNTIVNIYNKALQAAEESSNSYAKTAAFVGRFLLPIVKIPTNFVGESLNYAFGSARAVELLGRKLTGNLKDMSPEDADGLMRSLKKGSIGAAAMAIGFFVPGVAGGYYLKGFPAKSDDEAGYDALMIGGVHVPRWAIHFPVFEAMQLGATMRKVYDKDIDKNKTPTTAITDGILRSSEGLIGEAPLFNTPQGIVNSLEGGNFMDQFVYPELGSMIPLGLQNIAQFSDVEGGGAGGFVPFGDAKYVKRKPETPLEQLEYRIPGLRQNVPEK